MAKQKLKLVEFDSLINSIQNIKREAKNNEFQKPNKEPIERLFEQRDSQRNSLFTFALWVTGILLFVVISIVITQSYIRIFDNPDFLLLNPLEFNVFVVSVFGECIGILYIIAKSLWDDKNYKDILNDKPK